ncbi:MAG: GAF domain-containing protein, partial [Terracidiphilus sp.]
TPTLSVPLEEIETCFEGVIPSPFCTCSTSGMPNVTYLSIVHRVDSNHVALSFQFFNKSRKNLLENPKAQVLVVEPATFRQFQLDLIYETTLTEGPIFERLRINLDAVASQIGMSQIFSLSGADIFQVLSCRPVAGNFPADAQPPLADHLQGLDALTERLTACRDLDALLTASLDQLSSLFGYNHSFLLVPDEDERRLFTIASRGFPVSGVGSEVVIGEGIIGTAAAQRSPIRNANLARDIIYSSLVRAGIENQDNESSLRREIPLPGLANAGSQLAVPLLAHDHLLGVLCLQSEEAGRFTAVDGRLALVAARQIAATMAMIRLEAAREPDAPRHDHPGIANQTGPCSMIKHYESDDSVFIDDAYLVKGVPGRLLRKIVCAYLSDGRSEFTNKEIRLDSTLQLPDLKENLETRLILLRRLIEERCDFLQIVSTGRGRFRFDVRRRLKLESLP